MTKNNINVLWTKITLSQKNEQDFISLTDIARYKNPLEPKDVVKNWMRNYNTVEYLGLWEKLNNPNFNGVSFDPIEKQAWKNAFTLSPTKWIESVSAIWIVVKRWKNGWTYAHKDIAFKFASWISVEFELYIIKEFQRLKEEEQSKKDIWWQVKRERIQDWVIKWLVPYLKDFLKIKFELQKVSFMIRKIFINNSFL